MIGLNIGRVFCTRNEPRSMKKMSSLTSLLLCDKYDKKEYAALYEVGKGSRLFLSLREKYKKKQCVSTCDINTEKRHRDVCK